MYLFFQAKEENAAPTANNFPIELYKYQQGSTVFKFYLKSKNLIAQASHDENIQQLSIKGILIEF